MGNIGLARFSARPELFTARPDARQKASPTQKPLGVPYLVQVFKRNCGYFCYSCIMSNLVILVSTVSSFLSEGRRDNTYTYLLPSC